MYYKEYVAWVRDMDQQTEPITSTSTDMVTYDIEKELANIRNALKGHS